MRIKIGDYILNYRVERKLGQGGMGSVYLVRDKFTKGVFAMKVARRTERFSISALKELSSWSGVPLHPNVVRLAFFREQGPDLLLFAEYVEGGSLRAWSDCPRSLEEIGRVGFDAAMGLAALHERSIVHQDIKPDNLLVGADGVTRVADFGLARVGSMDHESDTPSVPTSGYTLPYASPEQLNGLNVSSSTDVWSWGVSMLELSSSRAPRTGWLAPQLLHMHREMVRNRGTDSPELSQFLDLIECCLDRRPEERPSAASTAKTLAHIFEFAFVDPVSTDVATMEVFLPPSDGIQRRSETQAAWSASREEPLEAPCRIADDYSHAKMALSGLDVEPEVKELSELAAISEAAGDVDQALALHRRIVAIESRNGGLGWIRSIMHLAICERTVRRGPRSLRWLRRCCDEISKLDSRDDEVLLLLGNVNLNLSLALYDADDLRGFEFHLKQALGAFTSSNEPVWLLGEARVLTHLSTSYRMQGRDSESLRAVSRSVDILWDLRTVDDWSTFHLDLARAFSERSLILRSTGKLAEALEDVSRESKILKRLIDIGRLDSKCDYGAALVAQASLLLEIAAHESPSRRLGSTQRTAVTEMMSEGIAAIESETHHGGRIGRLSQLADSLLATCRCFELMGDRSSWHNAIDRAATIYIQLHEDGDSRGLPGIVRCKILLGAESGLWSGEI